jgi:hypothetical protein
VEPGSPFRGESHLGQLLSIGPDIHRTRQGQLPPSSVKSELGGFTRLSQVILAEYSNGSMLAHMKGCEGNLSVETQIRSFRVPGPLDGAPNVLVAGHPLCHFVSRSGCSRRL